MSISEDLTNYVAEIRQEATRPDGVIPAGWIISSSWRPQPQGTAQPRNRPPAWFAPSAPNLTWERMNLACVGVVAILVAFAIIAAVG